MNNDDELREEIDRMTDYTNKIIALVRKHDAEKVVEAIEPTIKQTCQRIKTND